jgi:nicotinamidase-related amidase
VTLEAMEPSPTPLFAPDQLALVLVDPQPGLSFVAQSMDHQTLLNNLVALARTARVFGLPVVLTTSATKKFSGPVFPQLRAALGDLEPIERTNMNAFEDARVVEAIRATGRRTLLFGGLLTEACVAFHVLSADAHGYSPVVVEDACAASTPLAHEAACRLMRAAGATHRTWLQLLLELQRDWTRHATYDGAVGIIKDHAGNYGVGLAYAKAMLA